jgi:hypothetical protein
MVNYLPKEMKACKESLQINILGKLQSEVIELLRATAAGKKFNDLVPRSAVPNAKLAAPLLDPTKPGSSYPKSPSATRLSTPCKRQQQSGQYNKLGGCGKSGGYRDSSGNIGGPGLTMQEPEKSMTSLLEQLKKLTSTGGMQVQAESLESVYTCSLMCQDSCCRGSDFLIDSGAKVHIVNHQSFLFNLVVYQPPILLSLATSDANRGIVASGGVCIMSPLGVPLWLHNVQCVLAATTNLVLVSAAISDGAKMVTGDTGAINHVVGPNQWNCPVRDVDGLYVLHGVLLLYLLLLWPEPLLPILWDPSSFPMTVCGETVGTNG